MCFHLVEGTSISVARQRRQMFKTAYNFGKMTAFHLWWASYVSLGNIMLFIPPRKYVLWNYRIYRSTCLVFLNLLILILLCITSDLQLCFEVRWLPPCIITSILYSSLHIFRFVIWKRDVPVSQNTWVFPKFSCRWFHCLLPFLSLSH